MKLNQKGIIAETLVIAIYFAVVAGLVGYSEGKKHEKVVVKEKVVVQVKEVQKECPKTPVEFPTKKWWQF